MAKKKNECGVWVAGCSICLVVVGLAMCSALFSEKDRPDNDPATLVREQSAGMAEKELQDPPIKTETKRDVVEALKKKRLTGRDPLEVSFLSDSGTVVLRHMNDSYFN